jgi:hypothetical protein
MELFGKSKHAWLQTFLTLPHGIPSHGRVSDVHFTTRHAMRRPPAERERERSMPGFAPTVTPTRS